MKGMSLGHVVGAVVGTVLVIQVAGVVNGFTESTAEGQSLSAGVDEVHDFASRLDTICESSLVDQGEYYLDLNKGKYSIDVDTGSDGYPVLKLKDGSDKVIEEAPLEECESVNRDSITSRGRKAIEADGEGVEIS